MRGIAIAIVVAGCCAVLAAQAGEPAGFGQLAEAYRTAHESGNVERLSALVCWDRVDALTRTSVNQVLRSRLDRPVAAVEFEPITADTVLEYEFGGVVYRPNLAPVGFLVVRFAADESTGDVATQLRFLIGRKDGVLLIATGAPEVRG